MANPNVPSAPAADAGASGPAKGGRWRAWLALFSPLPVMGLVFFAFGSYFAITRGLRGAEVGKAVEPYSFYPAAIVFSTLFALTVWASRKDGFTLAELGWRRPTPADVALGLGLGAAVAALNQLALYPLITLVRPTFDPRVTALGHVEAVVLQVIAVAGEDTLFRGYALQAFARRYSVAAGVALSCAGYGLVNAGQGWPLVLWALVFGAGYCALALWRRSLWPVAIAHFVLALAPRLLAELGAAGG